MKPAPNAAYADIKAYMIRNWKAEWWGGSDCDRCKERKGDPPCAGCLRWPHWVASYQINTPRKVGDTIYCFDENRRVYRTDGRGSPIFEKHFIPHVIVGETSQSWIVGDGRRIGKKSMTSSDRHGGHRWFTERGRLDAIWLRENRAKIAEALNRCHDASLFRQIGALLGFDDGGSK